MARSTTSLGAIGPSVFLPTLLYGVGQGAIAPVIALSAIELGATPAVAGLLVAVAGVGQILGDIPAGWLTGRVGERHAMVLASVLVSVALVVAVLARDVWVLGSAIAATGVSAAVWGLARQAYITDLAPPEARARALSTLGGSTRIGMFLGPFLGAAAMQLAGTDGAYLTHLVMAVLAAVVLLWLPDAVPSVRAQAGNVAAARLTTLAVARQHLPVLRTLGVGVLLISAVRASRQVVIPLWADHIGLDATTTSLVFGVSGAVDMLLFYPAGYVMDRFGRVWVAAPSMLTLAVAHLLLPATASVATLTAVAMLMGFGNGMGSGVIMTLGADASPAVGRSAFLGVWRLCADAGNGIGPLVLSGATAALALGPAILIMGGVGVAAAAAMVRFTPRPPRPH